MEPQAGDLVTDNLKLVRLLGRGGMGSVWVARHLTLDVEVAVKFITKELLSGGDPLVLERFRREARLAAKIESPHVVRIFDHGLTKPEGAPYQVMELLRGESLWDRMSRLGRLAPGDAARVISEVATGLAAAHAMGVVHRDIKPHNVFLARSRDGVEVAKILDFGIAKATNAGEDVLREVKTSTGVLIGTPQYMSPEQLMRAGPADARTDLWALAVVAYEIITGKLPFAGETLAATLVAITRADIRPPSSAVPEAPHELDGFFTRALAVDVDKRFPDAATLAAAFAEACGGITPASVIPSDVKTRPALELATNPELTTAQFLAAQHAPTAADAGERIEFAATQVDQASLPPPKATPARSSDDPLSVGKTKPSMQPGGPPAQRGTADSKTPWLLGGGAIAAAAVALLVWPKGELPPVKPGASVAPSTTSTATAAASASGAIAASANASGSASSEPGAAPPPPFKRQAVAEGRLGEAVWVGDFWVQRDEKDVGLGFLAADAACRKVNMALCTDAQLERACAQYPELGRHPNWTMSSESGGFVIRGGPDCAARTVTMADDVSAGRAASCCTRSLALAGDVKRLGAPRNVAGQVSAFESAVNFKQGERFAKKASGSVGFFNQTKTPAELADALNWLGKGSLFLEDRCTFALIANDPEQAYTLACTGLELELAPAGTGDARAVAGVKQVFQRFEFTSSGYFRDARTWQHPRRVLPVVQ